MDLIDRQAALDALRDRYYKYDRFAKIEELVWAIEALPSAQPTEASCWGCNCPKMERSKEQKTFSEMVHLHDVETSVLPSAQPEPIRLRLDHELSKEEYERLKKDCAEQPITVLPKESAQPGEDIRAMCGECDAWNQYKNHPQPGWIPWDSGELPKKSGWYIVTAYDGRTSRTTFAKYQKRLKRWDLTGARAYWRVLAFAPLPEPYRAAGGETDGEA